MIYTSIYIWYIGYIVETDISKVSNGMKSILKAKDNVVLNNLPILRNDEIGELVKEFNLIQKNNNNQIYRINKAKNMMIEQERLASLGQMIGGIAHNLKTPIFSISGANMALLELTNELSKSVDDERVDKNDYKEIAKEMKKEMIDFEVKNYIENNVKIYGNNNILIQIIMNLIQNSIESYEYISKNDLNRKIILKAETDEKKENMIISIEDFGSRNSC